MRAASGLFSWDMELLASASRQFAPTSVWTSVRFIRIILFFFYEYYFPARIAGGGAKRLVYLTKKKLVRTQTDDNGNTMLQKFSFQIIFKKIG